jgi:pimeloyl-ACP methyl ester carboxylesterase
MMVGHDQGSLMAGLGALIRPDMFPRLTLIGGGFGGPPSFPFNTANGAPTPHPEFTTPNSTKSMGNLIHHGEAIRIIGEAAKPIRT